MKKIYIIPIEKLSNRYTTEWYDHIPRLIENKAASKNKEIEVIIVDGDEVSPNTLPGAFLDFGATHIFKSAQLSAIANEFHTGKISSGDKFLFTDAWNPSVISIKYISELLNIPVEMHSLHHAGSWDKEDFLGRVVGNKPWITYAEKSMFHCYDTNWFATNFHLDMFIDNLFEPKADNIKATMIGSKKIGITGWPMEYLSEILEPYSTIQKKQQIIFPHRIAPEKQLEIFKDLEKSLPQYNWIACQEKQLSKHEYHTILGESKISFSASLQETLGICQAGEAPMTNTIPLCPDRLSYSEIFKNNKELLYPSEWTINWNSYIQHKDKLIDKINYIMQDSYKSSIEMYKYKKYTLPRYFTAPSLFDALLS